MQNWRSERNRTNVSRDFRQANSFVLLTPQVFIQKLSNIPK